MRLETGSVHDGSVREAEAPMRAARIISAGQLNPSIVNVVHNIVVFARFPPQLLGNEFRWLRGLPIVCIVLPRLSWQS